MLVASLLAQIAGGEIIPPGIVEELLFNARPLGEQLRPWTGALLSASVMPALASRPVEDRPTTADIESLDTGDWVGRTGADYTGPETRNWFQQISQRIAAPGAALIYRVRNRIFHVASPVEGESDGWCVKAFKRPSFLRSLAYSLSPAGSKAMRSFNFSRHLQAHGVGVAAPVAYLERWNGRRQEESYFITAFLPGMTSFTAETIRLFREDPDAGRYIDLIRVVATAVRAMHDAGFIHRDLGGQNILIRRRADGGWDQATFIDLNRGSIRPRLSARDRARDLATLEIPSYFKTIFFHIYFGDTRPPREFMRWERVFRTWRTWHNRSRKYRHPIRHLRDRNRVIAASTDLPKERDMWLWDAKSGQPAVVLERRDRMRNYARKDLIALSWHLLRDAPGIWTRYHALKAAAYSRPVAMTRRIGISVDLLSGSLEENLRPLDGLAGIPVLVRCYFHRGEEGLKVCRQLIARLAAAGHEVTLALVQSRQAVLDPAAWITFCEQAIAGGGGQVKFVEIGHALNRAKWGTWTFAETASLYDGLGALRARHPDITFLGAPVNDFEFHYYPPLLARIGGSKLDGLAGHLYVDRRGAPESKQGRFALLEKAALARAIAEQRGVRGGYYVTETNWPLRDTGIYSPVQSMYRLPDQPDSAVSVSEETYAAYMVRYYLIALCSGLCERVWWWNLSSRGFGLVDDVGGFRRRPAWHALAWIHRTLAAATFVRRVEDASGAIWFEFDTCRIAYALRPLEIAWPASATAAHDLYGNPLPRSATLRLSGEPVTFLTA
ncbi:MAG TPA: lipopolysaccharide kinase InaA family protein [Opitutaceae bacterium]